MVVRDCTLTVKLLLYLQCCCLWNHTACVFHQPYDKNKLKCISKADNESLAFVFYMQGRQDGVRIFESAHCEGWFIHTTERFLTTTQQEREKKPLDDSFYFIIRGKTCWYEICYLTDESHTQAFCSVAIVIQLLSVTAIAVLNRCAPKILESLMCTFSCA